MTKKVLVRKTVTGLGIFTACFATGAWLAVQAFGVVGTFVPLVVFAGASRVSWELVRRAVRLWFTAAASLSRRGYALTDAVLIDPGMLWLVMVGVEPERTDDVEAVLAAFGFEGEAFSVDRT